MTWTEPEAVIADADMIEFAFGSLNEEEQHQYEIARDPAFTEDVIQGTFTTLAQQANVDLATVSIGTTALNLTGFDLSADTILGITQTVVAGMHTITATAADAAATVTVSPTTLNIDAADVYAITVTIDNSTSQRVYQIFVTVTLLSAVDITLDAANDTPIGIVGVGSLLYVIDSAVNNKAFAYVRDNGARSASDDITLASPTLTKQGIASSDHRLYVINADRTVLVYDHSGTRVTAEEFTLNSVNSQPRTCMVYDGHLYVLNVPYRIYCYRLSDGQRQVTREWNISTTLNMNGYGIWTDGSVFWIADDQDGKVYAYTYSETLNGGNATRVTGQEFDTLQAAGNTRPRGMWSDGTVMWIGDWVDGEVYVYNVMSKAHLGS